ncbi:MAG TPA: amidohydrolase family protein [Candidatus Aquilonibacter sp.]|nr:amidohydrolase family protein [Candidatus Aquilonibacter sp.]
MIRLIENARFYAYDRAARSFVRHRSLLVDGTRIAAVDEEPVGAGVQRIDLDGLTVVPAFTDCHVHLAETGHHVGDRSLRAVGSYDEYASRIERARPEHGMLYMGLFDDALWADGTADARPIERAHRDAIAMIVRIDGHSSIVNRKTLAWLELPGGVNGIERDERGDPTGRLFYDANWRAQKTLLERMPVEAVRAAERRAASVALANGIVAVHAQLLGRDADGYAADIESFRALPITVHPKICEPDARIAQRFDLPYVGGDVFLDGSIGSCTAALERPYLEGGRGELRFSDDELFDYFSTAEELGVSAGVHAIGDAAIDQCIRTWTRVLGGRPSARGCRHFIEHFELARQEHIEACASMQIHLSMQPQFDAYWGADGGMYEHRLGRDRKRSMNALRDIVTAGTPLCGGSDSPVCEFDALAGMQACVAHHEPAQRLWVHEALALYTVAAARFGFVEAETGNLEAGLHADLAVLDGDPFERGSFEQIRVVETWRQGEIVTPR